MSAVRQRRGVDVDLNADLRLLGRRLQRARRVRVLEREILDVLRHHVELRLRIRGRRRAAIGRRHEISFAAVCCCELAKRGGWLTQGAGANKDAAVS